MAHLPVNRTKTIMKTTEGADSVSKEAVFITTRAAELFIKELAVEGVANMKNEKKLGYNHLVNVVHSQSRYEFLEYMIPKKITVRQYKEMLRDKNDDSGTSESESSSSSSSNSGSESDEENK